MPGSKELKTRIVSVKNTRKITRTMEMVATAKSKRMTDRVNAAKPYGEKINNIILSLADLNDRVDSPLLRKIEEPVRIGMVVVTANRGLCGGYNTNLLKLARERIALYRDKGQETDVHVIGKKGISYFRFSKIDVVKESPFKTIIDDKLEYRDAEEMAEYFTKEFSSGNLDRVEIVSTIYHSSARQKPGVTTILPIGIKGLEEEGKEKKNDAIPEENHTGYKSNFIYEPGPEMVLKKLLPLIVKTMSYRALLEAVTSEQIHRRIAMKNATDSAGDMIQVLTRYYNRKRQASITQEISEIVAGADSVG